MNTGRVRAMAEVFPIRLDRLPDLVAYSPRVSSDETERIGGKLAYQCSKKLGGHWVWTGKRILTDRASTQREMQALLRQLWRDQPEVFRHLLEISPDLGYHPSSVDLAKVVARGLARDHEMVLRRDLARWSVDLDLAGVERIHEIHPLVVAGTPCVSISVSSRIVYKMDVHQCLQDKANPSELIGYWVADKFSGYKGEIREVIGSLGDLRERLLNLTSNERTREILKESPDDTFVLRVGREGFDYAATCLRVVLQMDYIHEFGVNPSQAQQALRIAPSDRWRMVNRIAGILRMNDLIALELNSQTRPKVFLGFADLRVNTRIRLGDGTSVSHSPRILDDIRQHGLYLTAKEFSGRRPIRMGVVRTGNTPLLRSFEGRLERVMSDLGLTLETLDEQVVADDSRHDLELAVDSLEKAGVDFVLGVFRESPNYYQFKDLTVGRGISSQVVLEKTLRNKYAFDNIVLGIVGKTGSIPYVLETPLEYADMVVGIDIARRRKERLSGSVNVAAVARIYFSDGQFVRYVIHDEPIEGETLPPNLLQKMFPSKEFGGKRVVIHRDGKWRGDEKSVLQNWAKEIGAELLLVEVIKSGAPRLYSYESFDRGPRGVCQAYKGTTLKLSSGEAIVVSTPPPFRNATAQPLRVRTGPGFTIEEALHSVMSLTLLHYGSTRQPRLPVTIHYSNKIAGLALNGVKPRELVGSRLYWL